MLSNFHLFFGFVLLVVAAISIGVVLTSYLIRKDSSFSASFVFGASYFLGISFYIVFFKTAYLFFEDVDISVFIMFGLAFLLVAFNVDKLTHFVRSIVNKKFIVIYWLPLLFIVCIVLLGKWLPSEDIPFFLKSIGSLHSPRYAWISNYIEYCNSIPILGQNTGQSVLAFIAGYVLTPGPYLFLFFWLAFSVFSLGFFIHGVLYKYVNNSQNLLWGVAIFLLGSTAFSITHVLVVDSGSPFFFSGYTDTLIGLFSVFFIIILFHAVQEEKSNGKLWWIMLLLLSVNYLSSPQNIVLIFLVFSILFVRKTLRKYSAFYFLAVFLLSAVLFIPQGGMLTPSSQHTEVNYSGMMSVSNAREGKATEHGIKEKGVIIYPGYPFHYDGIFGWKSGQTQLLEEALEYKKSLIKNISSFVWTLERVVINSIVVLFFPIAGLIYLKKYRSNPKVYNKNEVDYLYFFGLLFFIFGLLISFPFSLNGYKWELSRFMIPGIAVGMLGFSLFVVNQMKKTKKRKVLVIFISSVVMFGPISTQLVVVGLNISSDFSSKMSLLLSSGPSKLEYECN